jgi:hypothetical protein
MPTTESELDRLASELALEVRDAAAARTNSELVSMLDAMTKEVDATATAIQQTAAVLRGPSPLTLPPSYADDIRGRNDWVAGQVAKVRAAVESDPMRVRQGKLWSDTQKAFNTLRAEVVAVLSTAYGELLDSYASDDRQVLETLPPGVTGARDYSAVIGEFEQHRSQTPQTLDSIRAAVAVARRLKDLRERVESESVPEQFQDEWRQIRTTGLPLTKVTDEFMVWLRDPDLAKAIVLTYGAP